MTNAAKLDTQARLPDDASPPEMPTMFDSAMPTLKNRCGNFFAKCSVRVELCTSPSTTTRSGCCSPRAARASPNASRVDLPSFISPVSWYALLCAQECKRLVRLFRRQRFAVMVRVARQDRLDRPALDGLRHDDARLALVINRLLE